MINCCNCYRTDGKRNDCYYHIQAMTATLSLEYAAIVVSVLYRMLTLQLCCCLFASKPGLLFESPALFEGVNIVRMHAYKVKTYIFHFVPS